MDTKSLAKSKRAHSQHHSRGRRPNQPRQTVAAKSLDSNWDRYTEEDEAEFESASQSADSVLPKSKGADYRYLVAEAQSQASSHLPSLDDELTAEFSQAFGSMLSIKGDGILAWSADDNFVVDDESTAHPEARFLSLNLHVLADELGKIELSQRLFMDVDLLPPELRTDVSEASIAVEQPTEELPILDVPVRGKNVNLPSDATSRSDFSSGSHPDPSHRSSSALESSEAELDVLLDSFNEIEILGSPTTVSIESSSALTLSHLDEDLDDLLDKTTAVKPAKGSFVQPSSSKTLGTKSEPVDDFDSWFDTL